MEGQQGRSDSTDRAGWRAHVTWSARLRGTDALGAAVAAAMLALPACGGGSSARPGVAAIGSTTTAQPVPSSGKPALAGGSTATTEVRSSAGQPASSGSTGSSGPGSEEGAALRFAQCMRSRGVVNFPDPGANGSFPGAQALGNIGIDTNSPTYQAAHKACQSLLPARQQQPSSQQILQAEQDALKFAQCMRSHGVPNFPDPKFNTSGGGLSITISGPGSRINVGSPIVQAATKACRRYGPKPSR